MGESDYPDRRTRRSTFPLPIRIVVYPSDSVKGYLVAHCLELDLIGQDKTLEDAVLDLFQAIAAQVEACEEHDARLYFPAPEWVSQRYLTAKDYGQKIPDKVMHRIFAKLAGEEQIDNIVATGQVREDYILANV